MPSDKELKLVRRIIDILDASNLKTCEAINIGSMVFCNTILLSFEDDLSDIKKINLMKETHLKSMEAAVKQLKCHMDKI